MGVFVIYSTQVPALNTSRDDNMHCSELNDTSSVNSYPILQSMGLYYRSPINDSTKRTPILTQMPNMSKFVP